MLTALLLDRNAYQQTDTTQDCQESKASDPPIKRNTKDDQIHVLLSTDVSIMLRKVWTLGVRQKTTKQFLCAQTALNFTWYSLNNVNKSKRVSSSERTKTYWRTLCRNLIEGLRGNVVQHTNKRSQIFCEIQNTIRFMHTLLPQMCKITPIFKLVLLWKAYCKRLYRGVAKSRFCGF